MQSISRRLVCVSATLTFAFSLCPASADDVQSVKDKLFQAKKEYDGEVRKFRKSVTDWLDKREETIRNAGDKKQLDRIKTERKRFEETGELPTELPTSARRQMNVARLALDKAYQSAVSDYIRLKEDAVADIVEKERQKYFLDSAFVAGKRTPLVTLKAFDVKAWNNIFDTNAKFTVNGVSVPQSILIHPDAKGEALASFAVGGKATVLRTTIGIPNYTNPQYPPASPVTFEILGDGKSLWKSEPVTKLDAFQTCTVNVGRVKTLTLRVTCRDHGWAHAAWLAPTLVE